MDTTEKKYKVVLIDDEKHGRDLLKKLISTGSSDFLIAGEAFSVDTGIAIITETQPDVVFLDIELSDRNGFEILQHFDDIQFSVIFATAYNYYAIKAIKFSALDYLVKPIDEVELYHALDKVRNKNSSGQNEKSRVDLALRLMDKTNPDKIAIPTNIGYAFLDIQDIIRCSSENNYTRFHLNNKTTLLTSHTLKEYETLLKGLDFFRVHNSHLINMKYVQSFLKGKGGIVLMKDGTEIEVSTRRKELFLQKFVKL